jgi:hypothetical protein
VGPAAVVTKQPGGGGITSLLTFLVVAAFGLMTLLFVGSTTHAPVMVPPAPPSAQSADPGPSYDADGGMTDRELRRQEYEHRWETQRQHHEWPPRPQYPPPNQWHERGSDSDR